jgi:PAS domain S-box-containing protein
LRERAISSTDLAAVASLRITVNITMNRTDRAIEVGLEQLRAFGIEWSDHPNEDEVQAEYELLRRRLGEHPIETLAELVSTRDRDVLAVMQILREMLPAAIFIDQNLHHLAVLRMSNLSLEHGHCDSSPLAFAELSMVVGPRFGHRHDGFRFGSLGMALAEPGDLARFRGKVYVVVAYHSLPWTGPVRAALAVVRRALALTQGAGDMQFATFSAIHVSALRLAAGDPLEDVQAEAERHLAFCRYTGFYMVVYCFLGQLQLMRSLRGQPDLQNNDSADEGTVEQVFAEDPSLSISACWYWVRKLQACFHVGDYATALEMAARAERLLWTSPTFFGELTEYHFYSALARAKAWDSAPKAEAPGHHQALAGHHALLANWATSCPDTFGSRAALAAAELARLEDRVLDAEGLYEEAIRSASTAGFANIEALASEMAGHFYRNRGFERLARTYFANASSCYRRWGATAVARRLDAYSGFAARPVAFRPTDTTTTSVEELDLAMVIKASQTISGEILIDKLVETLMVTAVEHAGAERGRLIIRRGEELLVAAEATTQLDAITVRLLRTAAERSDLPHTVLNYVLRTQEAIILDDAAVANQFSADSYLAEHRVRSLLFIPLVKQMTLVGVLFLENSVASHVFTPSRTALLKLLASQAAISLENARLFEDLQESQQYLAEAQRLSQTGSWAWNPATGEIRYWSEECYHILGFGPSQPPPIYETFFHRIHIDDRAVSRERFEKAIHDKADFEFGYRIVHPDKGLRDIRAVGHAVLDRSGDLAEFVGTVIDITERKRAEQELQQLVDFVPQHIVVFDAGRQVDSQQIALSVNTRGLTRQEFRSLDVPDVIGGVIHPDDVERMGAARERGLAGSEPFEVDARLLGKDGIYRWFLARYNPLVEEGRVRRWYMSATEIESRKQEEERVRKENVRLEERTRIAQELHDTLLQTFQSASLHLSAALSGVAEESPVKPRLDRILQIMRQGIEEGRNAIQGLRSSGSQTSDLAFALSRIQEELTGTARY